MDQKKSEKLKTMLLFCLMFVGINYSLYTFVVTPKEVELESVKSAFMRGDENQSIYDTMAAENSSLKEEVEAKRNQDELFNELVMSQLDTIQLTYDFYTFSQNLDLDGISVTFDINEVSAKKEALLLEEEARQATASIGDDEMLVEEVVEVGMEVVEEEVLYMTVPIELSLGMELYQLEDVMTYMDDITNQKIYVKSINVAASSIQDEGEEDEVVKKDYLTLTINYVTYIDANADRSAIEKAYAFHRQLEGYEDIADLFATQREEDLEEATNE